MRKTIINDLSRFIGFDSVCTHGNASFAREAGRILKRGGFRVAYQKIRLQGESYLNVIGLKGPRTGRPFLICSHLDTVPPGDHKKWTRTKGDPWKAASREDQIYGLGSADDKGPLLAMLYAGARVPAHDLKRPLMVMGTFGEENGMGGAKLFIRSWKGSKPVAAIAGEPTGLTITYRHKGMAAVTIELKTSQLSSFSVPSGIKPKEFHGKQGHSSRPAVGVNALVKAVDFLRTVPEKSNSITSLSGGAAANIIPAHAELKMAKPPQSSAARTKVKTPVFPGRAVVNCFDSIQKVISPLKKRRDPLIDPRTITSTFSVARTKDRTLALTFDFRLLPGQSFRKIYGHLDRELHKRLSSFSGLAWKMTAERDNLPLGLGLEHSLVKMGRRLLKQNGLPVILRANPGCTEAGTYHDWGVPAIVMGPGEAYGNIHSPNESVSISQIEKAAQFYTSAIQALCVENKLPS